MSQTRASQSRLFQASAFKRGLLTFYSLVSPIFIQKAKGFQYAVRVGFPTDTP